LEGGVVPWGVFVFELDWDGADGKVGEGVGWVAARMGRGCGFDGCEGGQGWDGRGGGDLKFLRWGEGLRWGVVKVGAVEVNGEGGEGGCRMRGGRWRVSCSFFFLFSWCFLLVLVGCPCSFSFCCFFAVLLRALLFSFWFLLPGHFICVFFFFGVMLFLGSLFCLVLDVFISSPLFLVIFFCFSSFVDFPCLVFVFLVGWRCRGRGMVGAGPGG